MADKLVEILQKITFDNNILVLLLSMFPLIELKGAIPIGLKAGMELWQTALLSYAGSTLIFIPLFFLLIPLFNLLKKIKPLKRFIEKVETVLYDKAKKVAENADKKRGRFSTSEENDKKARLILVKALFLFVAVPFPVTGVWTGTAIAVFLGLKFKEALPAVAVGNLIAGSIITLLTFFFEKYVDIIIYVLFAIAIIMLIVFIVKIVKAKPEEKEEIKENE